MQHLAGNCLAKNLGYNTLLIDTAKGRKHAHQLRGTAVNGLEKKNYSSKTRVFRNEWFVNTHKILPY